MIDYIDMTLGDLQGEITYHSNKMTENRRRVILTMTGFNAFMTT